MFSKSLDVLYIARALTIGASASTLFGALWIVQGITALQAPLPVAFLLFVVLALLTLGMTIACTRLFVTAGAFKPSGDQQAIKQADAYTNIAVTALVVVSGAALVILTLWGYATLTLPATIISVGLFTLALAPVLRTPHYYVAGILLCVIPPVIVLSVPATIVVAENTLPGWTIINGIVGGLVNMGFGCANMVVTRRIRRNQPQQSNEATSQQLAPTQSL